MADADEDTVQLVGDDEHTEIQVADGDTEEIALQERSDALPTSPVEVEPEEAVFAATTPWGKTVAAIKHAVQGSFGLLTLVSILVALLSFALDFIITNLLKLRARMADALFGFPLYIAWLFWALIFTSLAVLITRVLSVHAAGSGIPQMKAILRGVALKEYLSLRTLVAKAVGVIFALGSGLPIGKEGPSVHMASIIAQNLMRRVKLFKEIYGNEARRREMLGAACAVGVASSFGTPVGGVLFSIEVTSTYFAVRNYWRGFYAAFVGAFTFRLIALFVEDSESFTTLFSTTYSVTPYHLSEIVPFAILGIACGFAGAAFVVVNRIIIVKARSWLKPGMFLSQHWFIYPAIITFIIATLTEPEIIGSYMGMYSGNEINSLFSTKPLSCLYEWSAHSPIAELAISFCIKFFLTAGAVALPEPAGVFVPVFVLGSLLGRFTGEVLNSWFSVHGNVCDGTQMAVTAGAYAVVGAAALTGAVTHTISTTVILFELTGSISLLLPVMIAVLLANAVAQKLSVSIYDSTIKLNGIPFIPNLSAGSSYDLTAARMMRKDVASICPGLSYEGLLHFLKDFPFHSFALIDSFPNRMLLGSVLRSSLQEAIVRHLGDLKAPAAQSNEPTQPRPRKWKLKLDRRQLMILRIKAAGVFKSALSGAGDASWDMKDPDLFDYDAYLTELGPDSTPAEQERHRRLQDIVDFREVTYDPSPFQVVDTTTLNNIHTIFALLGVNLAYITRGGRLVGVIGVNELREAIDHCNLIIKSPDVVDPNSNV